MATTPVLIKAVDSSNNVIPVSVSSTGEVNIASASALSVSGTVSVDNFPATQAVSASSLPLPSGASTSALQSTANGHLSTIATDTTSLDTKLPSQGQALSSASVPVVIASDQSAITVSSTLSASSDEDSITSLGAGSTDTGTAFDTAGYTSIGVIAESDQTDGEFQLKWSHDGASFFQVEEPTTLSTISEIGGGSSQNTAYMSVKPIAKYVRVDFKNTALVSANVKVLVNLF